MPATFHHCHSEVLPAYNGTEQQVKDDSRAVGVHGQFEDVSASYAFDMRPKHGEFVGNASHGDRCPSRLSSLIQRFHVENEAMKREFEDAKVFCLSHSNLACLETHHTLFGQTVRLREDKSKFRVRSSTPAAIATFIGASSSCAMNQSCAENTALQRTLVNAEENEGNRVHSCATCSMSEESPPVANAASAVSLDESVSKHDGIWQQKKEDQSLQRVHKMWDDIRFSKAELSDHIWPSSHDCLHTVYRDNHSMKRGAFDILGPTRLVEEEGQKCHGICNNMGSVRVSERDVMETDEDRQRSPNGAHIHSSIARQENPPISIPPWLIDGNDEQREWREHRTLDILENIRLRDAKLSERRSRTRSTPRGVAS